MVERDRRTLVRAAGASLLGLTVTGAASGTPPSDSTDPVNGGVSLLEVGLSFDFGGVEPLDWNRADYPSKYAIDPARGALDVRTVADEEATALATGDRVVNFRGLQRDADSVGGVTVNSLFRRDPADGMRNTYVYAAEGYEMPTFDIDWNARTVSGVLSAERVRDVRLVDGFVWHRLPKQAVEVRRKLVREEVVDDEGLPEWKRSRVIERTTTSVSVTPYLAAAFHPELDVFGIE